MDISQVHEDGRRAYNVDMVEKLIELKQKRNTSFIAFKYRLNSEEEYGQREVKLIELTTTSNRSATKRSGQDQESIILNHVENLKKLNHENLELHLDSFVYQDKYLFLINEHVGDDSLKTRIGRQTQLVRSYFEMRTILDWAKQLLSAVEYLHSHRIAHKNINLNTILIHEQDGAEKIKLSGLENSQPLRSNQDRITDLKAVLVTFYQLIVLDETVYDSSVYDLIIRSIRANIDEANNEEEDCEYSSSSTEDLSTINTAESSIASSITSNSTESLNSKSSNKLSQKESSLFALFQSLLDSIDLLSQTNENASPLINNLFSIKLREFNI